MRGRAGQNRNGIWNEKTPKLGTSYPFCPSPTRRSCFLPMIRILNIEAGFPTLDDARRQVVAEIRKAKREGVRVLKVIHGYGSSGKGGTLNHGLRKSFALRKKENVIKDFVPGESFDIFNATVLALLEAVPALRGDPDLGQANLGITILWLK